jgi:hypothetical protein
VEEREAIVADEEVHDYRGESVEDGEVTVVRERGAS